MAADPQIIAGLTSLSGSAKHLLVVDWLTVFQDLAVFMAVVVVIFLAWNIVRDALLHASNERIYKQIKWYDDYNAVGGHRSYLKEYEKGKAQGKWKTPDEFSRVGVITSPTGGP